MKEFLRGIRDIYGESVFFRFYSQLFLCLWSFLQLFLFAPWDQKTVFILFSVEISAPIVVISSVSTALHVAA